jgi:hypothetical protein
MGQLPASELDPHIAQEIANSRDRRAYITLEFAHLFALILAIMLYCGESHLMLADPNRQIGTHLLDI